MTRRLLILRVLDGHGLLDGVDGDAAELLCDELLRAAGVPRAGAVMHRAIIETAVTKALLDTGLAWGAAMPAFLDTVESVTDAVMATEQAPPADPTRYKSRSFQIEDEGQPPPADPPSDGGLSDAARVLRELDEPPADLREQQQQCAICGAFIQHGGGKCRKCGTEWEQAPPADLAYVQSLVDHADRCRKRWPDSGYWRGRLEALGMWRNELREQAPLAGSKPTPTSHTACGTGNWTRGTSAQGYGGIDPDAGSKP